MRMGHAAQDGRIGPRTLRLPARAVRYFWSKQPLGSYIYSTGRPRLKRLRRWDERMDQQQSEECNMDFWTKDGAATSWHVFVLVFLGQHGSCRIQRCLQRQRPGWQQPAACSRRLRFCSRMASHHLILSSAAARKGRQCRAQISIFPLILDMCRGRRIDLQTVYS